VKKIVVRGLDPRTPWVGLGGVLGPVRGWPGQARPWRSFVCEGSVRGPDRVDSQARRPASTRSAN